MVEKIYPLAKNILTCIVFFSSSLFSQVNIDKPGSQIDTLLKIFKSAGETEVKKIGKDYINHFSNEEIIKLAERAQKQKDEALLKITLLLAEEKNDKKTSAEVFLNFGTYCYFSGKYNDREYFQKSLDIFRELKDTIGMGNASLKMGMSYLFNSQNEKALEMLSTALIFFNTVNDSDGQAYVYRYQGDYYSKTGNLDKSLEFYEKALRIFALTNNPDGLGKACFRKAITFMMKSKFTEALELFSQAKSFFLLTNDYGRIGEVYSFTGDVYFYKDMYDSALVNYQRAKVQFENAGEVYGLGNAYLGIGNCFRAKSDYKKALETFQQTIRYYEMFNEPLSLGNVYMYMGDIYLAESDLLKANQLYYKALSFYETAKDPWGQANILYSLGNIYYDIGENDKASEFYYKVLPLYQSIQNTVGIGNTYHNLGRVYFNQQDYLNAMKMERQALSFYEAANSPLSLGNDYFQQGEIFSKTSNPDSAFILYSKADDYYKEADDLLGQGNVCKSRGEAFAAAKEYKKAFDQYNKALDFYNKANVPEMQAKIMFLKADVYIRESEKDSAYSLYKNGIAILEDIRNNIGPADMKMSYQGKMLDAYESAAVLMLENNKNEDAFSYIESMKARGFLDQIVEKKIGNYQKGLSIELTNKKDSLINKLSSLKALLRNAKSDETDNLLNEISDAENNYLRLIQEIRKNNPAFAMVKYPVPVKLHDVIKNLNSDEALIEYFISSEKVYAFVITANNFIVVTLRDSLSEIQNECSTYLKSLTSQKFVSIESKLYDMIIKPLEGFINNKHKLIIVPEGILASLPFEAIICNRENNSDKPEYLIERYTIKYIQSAALLTFQREHKININSKNSFVGFGDPVYDYENFSAKKREKGEINISGDNNQIVLLKGDNYKKAGGIFTRLEGSGAEVEEIARLFEEKKVYTRLDACEENLKNSDMKKYNYILLSCHGILGDGFQSLVLSQIPNAKEDGFLTLDEIMNLDWDADMVVLSACQSGKGNLRKGEGVIGLTRAVMYAGTPSAVVSLWNVDEQGTKELMLRVFTNIRLQGLSKEEALRTAKLEMLKTNFTNPFYWSAFVLYGE